jgi:hypothetical protein
MVVDCHGQNAFCSFLSNNILSEQFKDFLGSREIRLWPRDGFNARRLVANDVVTQVNALVADENRRTCDKFLHLVLALTAEGAVKQFFAAGGFFVRHRAKCGWRIDSILPANSVFVTTPLNNLGILRGIRRQKNETPERMTARAFFAWTSGVRPGWSAPCQSCHNRLLLQQT